MFANPDWFRPRADGRPSWPWQAWAFVAAACATWFLPALYLLSQRQGFEGGIWLTAIGALLAFEARDIRRQLNPTPPPMPSNRATASGASPFRETSGAAPTPARETPRGTSDVLYIGDDDAPAGKDYVFRLKR